MPTPVGSAHARAAEEMPRLQLPVLGPTSPAPRSESQTPTVNDYRPVFHRPMDVRVANDRAILTLPQRYQQVFHRVFHSAELTLVNRFCELQRFPQATPVPYYCFYSFWYFGLEAEAPGQRIDRLGSLEELSRAHRARPCENEPWRAARRHRWNRQGRRTSGRASTSWASSGPSCWPPTSARLPTRTSPSVSARPTPSPRAWASVPSRASRSSTGSPDRTRLSRCPTRSSTPRSSAAAAASASCVRPRSRRRRRP